MNEEIKEFYDDHVDIWKYHSRLPVREVYLNYLTLFLKDNSRVLDIGCGCGWDSYLLSKSGISGIGIDLSMKSISVAKNINKSNNWDFFQSDLFQFETKEKFDAVLCSMVIMNYRNLPDFFRRLKGFLKEKGIVSLVTNNPNLVITDYKLPYPEKHNSIPYIHHFTQDNGDIIKLGKFLHSYEYYFESALQNNFELVGFKELCIFNSETAIFNNTKSTFPNFINFILKK